jgi:hypothetical protein
MTKPMKSISLRFAAIACVLLALSASADAAPVISLVDNGVNTISDENREYLIDNDFADPLGTGFGIVGQIDVGDSFRGAINFNTLNSVGANLGGLTGNNELTGVFQAMVSAITIIPVGLSFITIIDFVPDPAFEAIYGTGAVLALFDDPANDSAMDFDDPAPAVPPAGPDDGTALQTVPPSSADVSTGPYASEEAFIATNTGGTPWITLGFTGAGGTAAPGEGIQLSTGVAPAPFLNVLAGFTVTSGTTLATANLGLGRIDGPGVEIMDLFIFGPTVSPFGGFVDVAASTNLRGVSDLNTPFELSTNTNASFNGRLTPEPGSMVLLGMGAMGVFGAGYRRRRQAQKDQAV